MGPFVANSSKASSSEVPVQNLGPWSFMGLGFKVQGVGFVVMKNTVKCCISVDDAECGVLRIYRLIPEAC